MCLISGPVNNYIVRSYKDVIIVVNIVTRVMLQQVLLHLQYSDVDLV